MEGVKEAFCPLLMQVSGAGYCDKPFDCASCEVMRYALSGYPEEDKHWICPTCIDEISRSRIPVHVPGYYTEGYCQNPACSREGMGDRPPRYSILLQLVLGRLP
jgi:hypothetical protein